MAAEDPELLDEWAPSGIRSAEEIRDIFCRQFFFGCEGDDPLNALAFGLAPDAVQRPAQRTLRLRHRHWDVPDMSAVGREAFELAEEGIITAEDFRDFVLRNPIKLWTGTNPDFFRGTIVAGEVARFARPEPSRAAGEPLSKA